MGKVNHCLSQQLIFECGLTCLFRWSVKQPLHVLSSPPASASSSSNGIGTSNHTSPRPPIHSRTLSSPAPQLATVTHEVNLSASMSDSQLDQPEPLPGMSVNASGTSFTTALAMLLYDVCYLAHTQSVEVPLAQAGEVLGNLWAVCCSPELGR